MLLELVPEQTGKFARFAELLQGDFPNFVLENRSVYNAMEKYGLFLGFEPEVGKLERHNAMHASPEPGERKRIILRSLVWGLPPAIMIMDLFGEDANPAGMFDLQFKRITIHKDLVALWQDDPTFEKLGRILKAVLVHELVHYYNNEVIPGTKLYSSPTHFNQHFSTEAYGPLSWSVSDYVVFADVLQKWKSQAQALP